MDLVDAAHLVFHRILNGDDFFVRRIDLAQAGVERGGFTATGGACNQKLAIRFFDQPFYQPEFFFGEPHLTQIKNQIVPVQDSHDHAFPIQCGKCGNTHINIFAENFKFDTSILW